MKTVPLKKLLFSNAPLKIISLFLGYSLWYVASLNQTVTLSMNVPLCFNALQHPYDVQAPETIDVLLQGKRAALHSIDKTELAAHVDIGKLLPGKHGIILNERHLFLPQTISLVQYTPANISIAIVDRKTV